MHRDFRRNVLATLDSLLAKIHNLNQSHNHKTHYTQISKVLADAQMLKSDVILILNQNFHQQCKLSQKDRTISHLEDKYAQLQESSRLEIRMAKIRHQKLLHSLRCELFLHQDQEKKDPFSTEVPSTHYPDFNYLSISKSEQMPTPRKVVNLKNINFLLQNRDNLHKQNQKQDDLEREVVSTEQFNPEITNSAGISSEEIAKLRQNYSQEKPKSMERSRSQFSNRKSHHGTIVPKKSEKRKHQQLKGLVLEQIKIPAFKQ